MKKIYPAIAALTLLFVFSQDSFAHGNRVRQGRGNRSNIVRNGGQGIGQNRVVGARPKPIYIDDIIISAKASEGRGRKARTRRPYPDKAKTPPTFEPA